MGLDPQPPSGYAYAGVRGPSDGSLRYVLLV